MRGGTITEKICTMCNRRISLNDNPFGLVFEDRHFVCEDCCDKHSKEEISKFTKTVMQSPDGGMPIALWLIHEQNKDKNLMTLRE